MIDAPPPLETITVTAPRVPARAVLPALALEAGDLEEHAPRLLAELFRTLPGVAVRTNSRGEAVLRVRGSEERQVVVFLDGAPLSVPWDGRVDLGLLPPGLVTSIEVTKGPAPIEYGTNAVAGAVDLRSLHATDDGTRTGAAGEFGSFGWRSLSATLTHGAGDTRYALAAGYVHRDAEPVADRTALPYSQDDADQRTNTDLDARSVFASAGTSLGLATLGASLLHVDAVRGIAPEGHLDPATDPPRYWRYPDWRLTQLTVAADAPLGSTDLRVVAWRQWFGQVIDAYRSAAYDARRSREDDEDDTLGARATLGWQADRAGWRLSATTQTSTHAQVDTAFSSSGVAVEGPRLRYRQQVESLGAELDWRPAGEFTTTLGVAYDSAATPLTGDKPPQPEADAWAYSAIAHYQPGGSWELTLATGRRTRFATARELFGESLGRFLPNPDLQPETAWITELTFDWRGDSLAFSLTPFHTRGEDTLAQRFVTVGTRTLRQRYNLPGTIAYGIDLQADWQWRPTLALEFGGSLLEAHASAPNGLPGNQLPQRPEYEFSGGLTWRHPRGALARLELRHTGPAVDLAPDGGSAELSSATEINLRGQWLLGEFDMGRLLLTAAVDNLTNAVVLPQLGLPLAGRTLRLGIRLE